MMMSLAWLLYIITTSAAADDQSSPPVLDTDGQPVMRGTDYHILPAAAAATDPAGGLTLASLPSPNRCPLYVAQEPPEAAPSEGLPVHFSPVTAGEDVVREARDVVATFSVATTCARSTSWRIGVEDGETGRRFVATEGLPSYFRINATATGGAYQIASCEGGPRCGAAGILMREGGRFLALDGPAFPFRFKRV
ncbi:unnamed protein product [Linum tenue]|uniref:Uncharacterized protein n=2 Tax=Linum tenue TaxID=586396 RepID=A0AAV0RDL5_9ROSI|nr:unnamed protein product [Linum tenue]